MVALNAATGQAYVTNSASSTVSVIDTATATETTAVSVGSTPRDIALVP
ncbi:hypothetical protein FO488_14410 [Geobacter sp. FeAm09]|nr:hypothetical protein [Geobacter sp. FeAm09]QEM69233.1 hypothetical protein FO488_14410 [Geobacter sp. FeAm09]